MNRSLTALLAATFALSMTPTVPAGTVWHVLETPQFTVLSSAGEKPTRAWAAEFQLFIASLHQFIPFNIRRLPPLTVVIFDGKEAFDPFRPLDPNGRPENIGGLFTRSGSGSVIGLPDLNNSEQIREVIFHEGVHWCVSSFDQWLPLWFNEGVAEVFSTFKAEKDSVEWGRAIDRHVLLLRRDQPLPLEQLLYVTADNPLYYQEHRMGIFYAESWAFVHYSLFGRNLGVASPLTNYLKTLSSGLHPDEAFTQAYTGTYKEYDKKLWTYLNGGSYYVAHTRAPQGAVIVTAYRPAAPWEVEAAEAKLALGAKRMDTARNHSEAARRLGTGRPEVFEVAADVAAAGDRPDSALSLANQALELGSKDPWMFLLVGRERYQISAEHGGLLPADARLVCNLYERAINLQPFLREAYANLGGSVGAADHRTDDDRKFLLQGLRLFPDEALIGAGLAQLDYLSGKKEEALREIEDLISTSRIATREAHAYLVSLQQTWLSNNRFAQIHELLESRQFAEAITAIDQWLADNPPLQIRVNLYSIRQQAKSQLARLQPAAAGP